MAYHNYMKKMSLEFVSVLSTGLGLLLLSTIQASAQPLVKDTPTGNLTDGVDISINPAEPLDKYIPNKQQIMCFLIIQKLQQPF